MLQILATWMDVSGLGLPGVVLEALALWLEVFVCTTLAEEGYAADRVRKAKY